MGVTYYIMRENLIWWEFNLAIFYDLPNHQIKVLAKFSGYTVQLKVHSCSEIAHIPAVPAVVVSVTEIFLSNLPTTFSSTMHISPMVPSVMFICVLWIETAAPMIEKTRYTYS